MQVTELYVRTKSIGYAFFRHDRFPGVLLLCAHSLSHAHMVFCRACSLARAHTFNVYDAETVHWNVNVFVRFALCFLYRPETCWLSCVFVDINMKLAFLFCVFLTITLIGIYRGEGPGKEKLLNKWKYGRSFFYERVDRLSESNIANTTRSQHADHFLKFFCENWFCNCCLSVSSFVFKLVCLGLFSLIFV